MPQCRCVSRSPAKKSNGISHTPSKQQGTSTWCCSACRGRSGIQHGTRCQIRCQQVRRRGRGRQISRPAAVVCRWRSGRPCGDEWLRLCGQVQPQLRHHRCSRHMLLLLETSPCTALSDTTCGLHRTCVEMCCLVLSVGFEHVPVDCVCLLYDL